jgi:purine nucleosidase
VTAAAEFNVYCDAEAAQAVFRSPVTKTIIPMDLTSRVILNLDVLEKIPNRDSRRGELLRRILPGAFRAHRQQLGLEGIHLHDTVAIVAALHPELFATERMHGEVETEGTITYGATVFDRRRLPENQPNMDVAVEMDTAAVTACIVNGLTRAA